MGRFSVFNRPKFDIKGEIELLREEIRNIAELRAFLTTSGGKKYIASISQRITDLERSILALAGNPKKNKEELKLKHCLGACYKGLLSILETTLTAQPDKIKELKKREGQAHRLELQRRQFTR